MGLHLDALIIGGGPAGCATAIRLAQHGHSVAVVERGDYSKPRVGESLMPAVRGCLQTLGVWERFEEQRHEFSAGIVSVWGDDRPRGSSFLMQPFSNGWNLDRRRFDCMLVAAARDLGCRVMLQTHLASFQRAANGGWDVQVMANGAVRQIRADFLVDATGRASAIARRLGARRIKRDRLAAIVSRFSLATDDSRLLIEAAPNGWWYSAGLPDARMIVVYLSDYDLIPRSRDQRRIHRLQQLREAVHTCRRIGPSTETTGRAVSADTSRLTHAAGTEWIAVGDAAIALDPLSGEGIVRALNSAIVAADLIHAGTHPGNPYNTYINSIWENAIVSRQKTYQQETRWVEYEFWQRRHFDCVTHA